MHVKSFLNILLLSWFGFAGCAAPVESIGASGQEIVGGMLSTDEPAVVAIRDRSVGGLCSGTLIAPRVVLTAKHCVQHANASGPAAPSSFIVVTGTSAFRAEETYTVSDVATTPGVWYEDSRGSSSGALWGIDIGLLTLSRPMNGVEPRTIRRTVPTDQIGMVTKMVGFGTRPDGSVGTKYETTAVLNYIQSGILYTGPATCQGDSGGPMFQEDGQLIGVTSFGDVATCSQNTGISGFNSVYTQLELIDRVVTASGECVEDPPERCDGVDNDCDGDTDEDCSVLGSACENGDECVGGDCRDFNGTKACSQDCDPLSPRIGCPAGFYCRRVGGCEGACFAGEAPENAKNNGESCTSDTECESLFCTDPGDGRRRCLPPCRADDGMCMLGEVCAAHAGECSSCVDANLVSINDLPRGLGEGCGVDTDCASGKCFADDGVNYCSRACATDSDCGRTYHCRAGVCAAGRREGNGAACVTRDDCMTGATCASQDSRSWCAAFCGEGMPDCPTSFTCTNVGPASVCVPNIGVTGDACQQDNECVSGLCAMRDGEDTGTCSRECSYESPCGSGFACVRRPDGSGYCATPSSLVEPPDDGDGGCSVGASRNHNAFGWLWTSVIGLQLGLRYARRRASRRLPRHTAR